MMKRVLVTGAGGFIGHHLVSYLVQKGYWVRAVDVKLPEFEKSVAQEFQLLDLRFRENCAHAVQDVEQVYHLAADMGGIGYLTTHHATVAANNTMINVHMLDAALRCGVRRFLFSSTACVYPTHLQGEATAVPLKEDAAYPALPEEGYGWEKLYMEKLCQYFNDELDLETRVVRFHNVYGPMGAFDGGREKAPAALCRKVVQAQREDVIEIWGDGEQTRSFIYVDDCIEGLHRIMQCNYSRPVNLGTDELVSIHELLAMIAEIAGKRIRARHDLSKPQGVRGRNSDNSLIRELLDWEARIPLREGLQRTYKWIELQMRAANGVGGEKSAEVLSEVEQKRAH